MAPLLRRRPDAPRTVAAPEEQPMELGHVDDERAPEPARPRAERNLDAERRLRSSGGPDDRAHYRCGCGYVFEASVSTSVACPHCGTGQAW
jgi:hypothetical protein